MLAYLNISLNGRRFSKPGLTSCASSNRFTDPQMQFGFGVNNYSLFCLMLINSGQLTFGSCFL